MTSHYQSQRVSSFKLLDYEPLIFPFETMSNCWGSSWDGYVKQGDYERGLSSIKSIFLYLQGVQIRKSVPCLSFFSLHRCWPLPPFYPNCHLVLSSCDTPLLYWCSPLLFLGTFRLKKSDFYWQIIYFWQGIFIILNSPSFAGHKFLTQTFVGFFLFLF